MRAIKIHMKLLRFYLFYNKLALNDYLAKQLSFINYLWFDLIEDLFCTRIDAGLYIVEAKEFCYSQEHSKKRGSSYDLVSLEYILGYTTAFVFSMAGGARVYLEKPAAGQKCIQGGVGTLTTFLKIFQNSLWFFSSLL